MKPTLIINSFLVFFLLISNNTISQDQGMSEEQKAWMEYMTPGWAHEIMAKTAGEWKAVTKYWMDPSADPMVSEGKAVNEMILGGRYLKSTFTSSFMDMPMEGVSIQSYDNKLEKFRSMWIDNMGTGMSVAEGTYDEDTKTFTFTGTYVDPMTGGEIQYRQTQKIVDDNKHLFEMYMLQGENEVKSMEIEYNRIM